MADLFLGGHIDPSGGRHGPDRTLLRSEDLVTHAVIVGMTGSGKTGLGVVLIEEALAAGVAVLAIDPKGDLTNLALTFPGVTAAEFAPWVSAAEAAKSGASLESYAEQQASLWRDGLAGWGLGPTDVGRLRAAAEVTIYTPGSAVGMPINILGSLAAPRDLSDPEILYDEIDGYVTGLLGLLGIAADPVTSREHILLSNLLYAAWSAGESLDLPTLLARVQQPPMRRLGVLELEVFFPEPDRLALALRLNGLLASPSFAQWLHGPPLDVQSMLRGSDGEPRCAVVTTSHLSDQERQSVTALILAKVVTWMRRQSGTSDLRALVYMDEVAGYVPPVANPPTKKPIMLLMKQARAFGVGMALATQNPVDVDYKALSNAGTWLVGRLQTERDKQRLLDGLASADGGVDVAAAAERISTLGKRQFLLRRANGQQEVLASRWAMSYLRGPLTRDEIRALTHTRPSAATALEGGHPGSARPEAAGREVSPEAAGREVSSPAATRPGGPAGVLAPALPAMAPDETPVMPTVADGIEIAMVHPAAAWASLLGASPPQAGDGRRIRLTAAALARVHLRYDDTKAGLVHDEEYQAVLVPLPQTPDAAGFTPLDYEDGDLLTTIPPAVFRIPDGEIASGSWWRALGRSLTQHLQRSRSLTIWRNPPLRLTSRVGESLESFRARCRREADRAADDATAALRGTFESRLRSKSRQAAAADRRAEVALATHDAQMQADVAATVGSLLGGLLGGRRSRTNVAAVARRRAASTSRVTAAQDRAQDLDQAVRDLEAELAEDVLALDELWTSRAETIEEVSVPLEAADIKVGELRLVWIPSG